jgi:hypothetical protein
MASLSHKTSRRRLRFRPTREEAAERTWVYYPYDRLTMEVGPPAELGPKRRDSSWSSRRQIHVRLAKPYRTVEKKVRRRANSYASERRGYARA